MHFFPFVRCSWRAQCTCLGGCQGVCVRMRSAVQAVKSSHASFYSRHILACTSKRSVSDERKDAHTKKVEKIILRTHLDGCCSQRMTSTLLETCTFQLAHEHVNVVSFCSAAIVHFNNQSEIMITYYSWRAGTKNNNERTDSSNSTAPAERQNIRLRINKIIFIQYKSCAAWMISN